MVECPHGYANQANCNPCRSLRRDALIAKFSIALVIVIAILVILTWVWIFTWPE